MRKPKDLVNFLFGESQQAADRDGVAEDIESIFEEMEEIEALEVKKSPLSKALKGIDVCGKVVVDELSKELCVRLDSAEAYEVALGRVFDYDNLHKLAQAGWVPAKAGEDDKDNFTIKFIEVGEAAPSAEKKDKPDDLEDLIKMAQEFATTPMKRDSATPPIPKKGIVKADKKNAPSGKAVTHAIQDDDETPQQVVSRLLDHVDTFSTRVEAFLEANKAELTKTHEAYGPERLAAKYQGLFTRKFPDATDREKEELSYALSHLTFLEL